jgi:hypothetical protein
MSQTKIIIAALWIIIMLIYLLGDVLRIISGDAARALAEIKINKFGWMGIAVLMLIPILMIFLTLVLPQPASRWTNILTAGFFFLFNLVGLPTYPSAYDKFLLLVSMGFNLMTIWYAWNWI